MMFLLFDLHLFFNIAYINAWDPDVVLWVPRYNFNLMIKTCLLVIPILFIYVVDHKSNPLYHHFNQFNKILFTFLISSIVTMCLVKTFQFSPSTFQQFLDIWILRPWTMGHLIVYSTVFLLAYSIAKLPFHHKLHFASLVILSSSFLWEIPMIFQYLAKSFLNSINPFNFPLAIMIQITFGLMPTILLLIFMRKNGMKPKKILVVPYLFFLVLWLTNIHFMALNQLMRGTSALPFIFAKDGGRNG